MPSRLVASLQSYPPKIKNLSKQKQEDKALQLYTRMERETVRPDESTFMLLFQACRSMADSEDLLKSEGAKLLHIGHVLHSDACKQGLNTALGMCNSLVRMYGKLGAVLDAEHLFRAMEDHDIVSWTNMLSVYASQSRGEKGLLLYRQMQEEGWAIDQHVLALAIQACATYYQEESLHHANITFRKELCYKVGMSALADANKCVFGSDLYVGNALLNMYSKCVGVAEAEQVFVSLAHRDAVAWTTMISAYVEHGQTRRALQLYMLMHTECVTPNELTFVIVLQGCSNLVSDEGSYMKDSSWKSVVLEIIRALDLDASKMGFKASNPVRIGFITAYGKCGDVLNAEAVFLSGYHLDNVARNALFSVYLENGVGEKALCSFNEMQKWHALIDEIGLVSLVHACKGLANLETCRDLHFYIVASGYENSISLISALIHTYAGCGSLEDVQILFDEVVGPDDVCWTAYIDGHAGFGNVVASADILERLLLAGVEPDEVSLTAFLLSCTNNGSVVEGFEYFNSLKEDHGVMEHLKHYGTMVSLLGRAGNLKRVKNFLSRMPKEMDSSIWSSLLRACYMHCDVELGRDIFAHALVRDQVEAPMCVVFSNICCARRHEDEED